MGVNILDGLAFFPPMYHDEDMRSIVYRYREWRCTSGTSGIGIGWIMKELFDSDSGRLSKNCHNLKYMISRFPTGTITVEELINKHTFFPLERLVSSRERLTILYTNIKTQTIKSKICRSHSSLFVDSEIRYCPKCLEEDIINYGEGYIHRSHQLRYLNVCSKHELYLFSKCPICLEPVTTARGKFDLHSAHCCNGHDLRLEQTLVNRGNQLENIKLEIIRDVDFLLNNTEEKNHDFLRDRYKGYLMAGEFVLTDGKYQNQEFVKLFLTKYPPDILKVLGVPIYNVMNYLPQGLVDLRKGLSNLLILNILVMRLFAGSAQNFFINKQPTSSCEIPFGIGPWLCKNKACPNHNEPTIASCIREPNRYYAKSSIIATFECPVCGFTYTRYARNGQETQKIKVLRYGALWENKLIKTYTKTMDIFVAAESVGVSVKTAHIHIARLLPGNLENQRIKWFEELIEVYERKQSLAAAARQLGISRSRVKRIFFKIAELQAKGFNHSQAIEELSYALSKPEDRRERARKQILALISENKYNLQENLWWKSNKDYAWLTKHDREWLTSVLPPVRLGRPKNQDWDVIDKELAVMVKEASRDLLYQNPRRRVTGRLICKSLPTLYYHRIIGRSVQEKFPKTMEQLRICTESKEEYQIRLLSRVDEVLKGKDMVLNVRNILKLRQYKNCSDYVREYVEKTFS